jgi:hypothetical protein
VTRLSPFIRLAVLVGSLASLQALATAADQPLPSPGTAPALGVVPSPLTWVDDIINALGQYFKPNYPTVDFVPYLKRLTVVRDALNRRDLRSVKVEMGAFFRLLTNRSYGISQDAADELANFARLAMPVHEYGIIFPRWDQGLLEQSPEGLPRTGQGRDARLSDAPLSLYP